MLVLVAGITGLVGQALAHAFLAAGHRVRGLSRNPSTLPDALSSRLESHIHTPDYHSPGPLAAAVAAVDIVLCAYHPTPTLILAAQLRLLHAAAAADVRVFHAASWNYPWPRNALGDHEQYDAFLMFRRAAALTCALRPLFAFTGTIVEYAFSPAAPAAPWDRESMAMTVFGDAGKRFAFTTVDDLAAYSVAAATAAGAERGGEYYVQSFRASFEELAATYEAVSGKALARRKAGEVGDVVALLEGARAGTPPREFEKYIGLAYLRFMLDGTWDYEAVDCERWGHVRRTSLREWFEAHPEV